MDCLYDVLKSFVGLRRIVFVDAFEVEVPYEELEYTVRDFRSALYNWEEKWGLGGEGKRFLEGVMFGVVKERDLEEGLEEEE